MSRFILAILIVLIVTCGLSAQDSTGTKTVYLKDGSVIKGQLVEDNDYYVKLLISTGDTLTIGYKNIVEKRLRLMPASGNAIFKSLGPKYHKTDGYFAAGSFGVSHFLTTNINLELIGGKRLSDRINLGATVNILNYNTRVGNFFIDPHYISFGGFGRYYLTTDSDKAKYFVSGSVAFAIPTNSEDFQTYREDYNNAIHARLDGGIHFASRRKVRVFLKAGIIFLKSTGSVFSMFSPNDTINIDYERTFIEPVISFGVEF